MKKVTIALFFRRKETAFFNFTCTEVWSVRRVIFIKVDGVFLSLIGYFSHSFLSLLFPQLMFSLSLPLNNATFHPSLQCNSFRCKVHTRMKQQIGAWRSYFFYDLIVISKILQRLLETYVKDGLHHCYIKG